LAERALGTVGDDVLRADLARDLRAARDQLLLGRRLHEAAGRLRERTTTVAEVAAALGYADQPHLTRDFARVTGMTPGDFAARYGWSPAR
jgi:AraC-like DNA-binding protein